MSRKDILARIKAVKIDGPALPEFDFSGNQDDLVSHFVASAESSASKFVPLEALPALLKEYDQVLNLSSMEGGNLKIDDVSSPYHLPTIDLLLLDGHFGVAENGAIWVTTDELPFRVLPFIAEHLVIGIKRADIVANMHDAYAKIQAETYTFGVYIAGPSKTADIEQSLVIGAQGPKSLTVVLM